MAKKQQSVPAAVFTWYSLMVIFGLGGLFLLLFFLLPYPVLKSLGDSLARDGSFERLSPQLYQSAHLPFLMLGAGLLLLVGLSYWKAPVSQSAVAFLLQFLTHGLQRLRADFPRMLASSLRSRPPAWELAGLSGIMVLAIDARILFLQRTLDYDEAYTYMEFARHSFWQVISDYHVPNNHVFHTILVHWSTQLFGNALWSMRLPALIAGLLIIPVTYLLGRRLYRPWLGLTAAGLLAVAPVMLSYSTNARGYTLVTLFSLLLFWLGDVVRKQNNLAVWGWMILFTTLGFYTIPIMLYPFGVLWTWLLLSGVLNEIDADYGGLKGWLAYLVGYGLLSAALTLCLYLPILRSNGILTVFNGNHVVDSLSWQGFFARLPERLLNVQGDWLNGGLPVWVLYLLLLGALLSLLLHPRISRQRVSVLFATLLFLVPLLLLQRPLIMARVWLFLLPLLVLSSVAGWSGLVSLIFQAEVRQSVLQNTASVALLVLALGFGLRFLLPYQQNPNLLNFEMVDNAALVTQQLKTVLQAEDVVVTSQDDDARYWYYFDYYQIPQAHIRDIKRHHFKRVLVINQVNPHYTVEEILRASGPDWGFLRINTLQVMFQVGNTVVYQLYPYQDVVDRTFGVVSQ